MVQTRKIKSLFWTLITLFAISGLFFSIIDPLRFESYQQIVRSFLEKYGLAVTLLAFLVLQIAQVVLTPISHYTVGMIGGFLYGPYLGGIINYAGRVVGHYCAFLISRKWGRRVLEKFVDQSVLQKYDSIFSGESVSGRITLQSLILFLIYFLPFFPDDEVSYLVGASRMPRKLFLLANVFGHFGGAFSLAYIGSGIDTRDPLFWFLLTITLLGFPIIWLLLLYSAKQRAKHSAS